MLRLAIYHTPYFSKNHNSINLRSSDRINKHPKNQMITVNNNQFGALHFMLRTLQDRRAATQCRRHRTNFSFLDFYGAIDEARVWAAYACCYVGGSADCPTPQQLKDFKNNRLKVSEEVEVLDHRAIKPILRLLEKIYSF